jgi:hypothetical protein
VSSGVVGGEVSVAPSGLVFFAAHNGCGTNVEEIPMANTVDAATLSVSRGGGTPSVLTTGIFAAAWS